MRRELRETTVGMSLVVLGVVAVATPACNSAAGEEYTGEALLEVHGSVASDQGDYQDKVLAVLVPGGTVEEPGFWIIDGAVSGEFPSQFEFTVTEPPPEEALVPVAGDTEIIDAYFSLVPREHPAYVERSCAIIAGMPDAPQDEPFTMVKQYLPCSARLECADTGDCDFGFVRTLECAYEPCELVSSTKPPGVEVLDSSQYGSVASSSMCYDGKCYSSTLVCDPEQAPSNCQNQVYACDVSRSGPEDRTAGDRTLRCSVVSEEGDARLADYQDSASVQSNFRLIYSSADASEGAEFPFKKGYNVQFFPDLEQALEITECEHRAWVTSYEECNSTLGTSYTLGDPFAVVDNVFAECQVLRQIELEEGCGNLFWGGLVENPSETDLRINLYYSLVQ